MSELRLPSDLFGVPFVLRRQDAEQLVQALEELWMFQTGRPTRTLSKDLNQLFSVLFNPRTSGTRLRELLDVLRDTPTVQSRFLRPPLVISAGSFLIVTPEGRALCGLLTQVLGESDEDPIGIDPTDALSIVSLAYEGYRRVGVKRLQHAVKLLSGEAEGLGLPSIGLLLLVLINGSTSPETAIRRPDDSVELDRLDASVAKAIAAFADGISPGSRDLGHFSLYSGYPVTEARRRFGIALGPSPDKIYVDDRHNDIVISRIASERRRARRSPGTDHARRSPETDRVMAAFDKLVSAYRAERPTLASLGVIHESRADTARLRTRLEQALGDA